LDKGLKTNFAGRKNFLWFFLLLLFLIVLSLLSERIGRFGLNLIRMDFSAYYTAYEALNQGLLIGLSCFLIIGLPDVLLQNPAEYSAGFNRFNQTETQQG
jgi:hypothetical protein